MKMHKNYQEEIENKLKNKLGKTPSLYILVNIKEQKLYLIQNGKVFLEYSISSAKNGIGNREGSFQTPIGIHRIKEKYGQGAPLGRVFKDRIDTGEDWTIGTPGENLILTRIMRLEGLEEGVNKGCGIDSYDRYIYIHGTNNERLIGTPMTQGCICMKNSEVTELFNSVPEGTIVLID
jgi:lipoprotein-anchoring transpeptidase ErfK/SrfK